MTDNDNVLIALTTCPSAEAAESLAGKLVEERLAACVTQLPGARSTYIWNGQVQTDAEVQLVIKTTAAGFEVLQARLPELHPYELPELLAIPVCAGSEKYLTWVRKNVKSDT